MLLRNKFISIFLMLSFLLGASGVTHVFACKDGKACEEAPGQVAKVETVPPVVTVDAAPNGFDNGNAVWKEPDANGIVLNPAGQGGVVVVDTTTVDVAPSGFINGNAEWKVPDENGVVVNPSGQGGAVVTIAGLPDAYTLDELVAFEATLTFACGEGASNSAVACWNHYTVTNLWRVQQNGELKPFCADTSNANNELTRDHGGWLVKVANWYSAVEEGRLVYGDAHPC